MFLFSCCNVVLIVLVLLRFTTPQRLQEKIDKLPECSNNCITKAAAVAGCGSDDFGCQCQKADNIIGIVGAITGQNACLRQDCGAINATSAQVLFRQICNLLKGESTSSSTVGLPTESPSESIAAPTTINQPPPQNTAEPHPPTDTAPTAEQPTSLVISITPEPVTASSAESAIPIVQSTPFSISTVPATTTLQKTTITPPLQTSSIITVSSVSVPVPSLSHSSTSALQSSSSSSQALSSVAPIASSSSAQAALLPSPAISISSSSATRSLLSASPTTNPYQAEANQSTPSPTPQITTTRHLPAPAVAAIIVGVVATIVLAIFAVLFVRRRKHMQKMRAISTASSRKSGEEITIYLDLQREKDGRMRSVEVRRGREGGMTEIPIMKRNHRPLIISSEERGNEFDFNFSNGLSSHPGRS